MVYAVRVFYAILNQTIHDSRNVFSSWQFLELQQNSRTCICFCCPSAISPLLPNNLPKNEYASSSLLWCHASYIYLCNKFVAQIFFYSQSKDLQFFFATDGIKFGALKKSTAINLSNVVKTTIIFFVCITLHVYVNMRRPGLHKA